MTQEQIGLRVKAVSVERAMRCEPVGTAFELASEEPGAELTMHTTLSRQRCVRLACGETTQRRRQNKEETCISRGWKR
jgi:hypothetical protein